jgi:iron(III) transport system ATP-binding protein
VITVSNLVKSYETPRESAARRVALHGVSVEVPEGKLVSLLGPSGCGKTTMLRSIAGLLRPDSGKIEIAGTTVFEDRSTYLPPERRGIGMVFQSYAIWPHMTVFDNVAYPLKVKKGGVDRAGRRERVMQSLALVGLQDYAERPAPLLSGGQQQRVALARAVVAEPKVLLLDEPLSNLDAKLRDDMRDELRQLQRRLGITALYVTHDQQEALSMSDEIVVMKDGHVLEVGAPSDLYSAPRSRFTANFVGNANFITGVARGRDGDRTLVETPAGVLVAEGGPVAAGTEVTIFFRPEDARLRPDVERPSGPGQIQVRVLDATYLGSIVDARAVTVPGDLPTRIICHPAEVPPSGSSVVLELRGGTCRIVEEEQPS